MVNDALSSLDGAFEALYTDFGRPLIAPERLIRASLIQMATTGAVARVFRSGLLAFAFWSVSTVPQKTLHPTTGSRV